VKHPKHPSIASTVFSESLQVARSIPSIEQLRQRPGVTALEERYGRRAIVDALRAEADRVRHALADGVPIADTADAIERGTIARLEEQSAYSLRPVINATGVIVHTNLGRAPLSARAAAHAAEVAAGYCSLEYDLETGARGRRDVHAESLICRVTGAEAACVVNNNAAATLLTLAALADGREVIVSRGELVEIGGGFRVPEVMAQSGAVLREVGTTNRTRVSDYAAAITSQTAAILRVHRSNFRIEGFTEQPKLEELAALGRRFQIPVIDDAGSGHVGGDHPALADEPSVRGAIAAGADVVMFSGDKLLGGPQAGIIAGKADLIEPIRRHPLMRALRLDKLAYAALEATLQAYANDRSLDVPVVRMISASADEIGRRADRLAQRVTRGALGATIVDGTSTIGGGSAPGSSLPTRLVQLTHSSLDATALDARLRALDPPVIARILDDHVVLDLRTVPPEQDDLLALTIDRFEPQP
jgi:L-seryl-tRNA(Ser) seleniumtransferase